MLSQRQLCVVSLVAWLAAPPIRPKVEAQEIANSTAQSGSAARVAVPDVMLRAGDHLKVTVLSEDKDLSGEFEISPDGTLRHPLYNKVKVVGIPVTALRERIASVLTVLEKDPQLEVEPLMEVTVTGEVNKPGVYFLPPETSIAKAIDNSAAGPNERGNPNSVTLLRGGRKFSVQRVDETVRPVSADKLASTDRIQSGDRITIGNRTSVLGKVSPFISFSLSLVSLVSLTLLVASQHR